MCGKEILQNMKMFQKSSWYLLEIVTLLFITIILLVGISHYKNGGFLKTASTPSVLLDYPKQISKLSFDTSNIESVLAIYFDNNLEKILFEKNIDKELPIASITKLMTAIIALELQETRGQTLVFGTDALVWKGSSNRFKIGDTISFFDALNTMLVESNNDIARAFAFMSSYERFVKSMNDKAEEIGMTKTFYSNPSGLDPDLNTIKQNSSSAGDLYLLAKYIIKKYPEILKITGQSKYPVYFANNDVRFIASTTNELLGEDFSPLTILGGKTGQTPKSSKNLIIITKAPSGGYVVFVVLGAKDHFASMKDLIREAVSAYKWN